MRVLTYFCFLVIFIGLFTSKKHCVEGRNVSAQQSDTTQSIPSELSHSIEFVQFLQKAGVKVEQVLRSKLEGFLGNENKAAFIRTDKGVVQVVIFPGEQDAERVTVTYSKSSHQNVPHIYVINGEVINGRRETINAAYPIYITLHKKWLIDTSVCELDETIKRALGQDNRSARR
jgi:hypothetical protein